MKNFGSLFYKPKKNEKAIKAKRWNIWAILGKAIRKTCTVIGAAVLISTLISVFLISTMAGKSAPSLPDDMVLYFNIEEGISESQVKPTLLDPFPFMQPTLRNIIDTLEKAETDKRVRGLVVKLNGASIGIAHTQELRIAIKSFRASGKFAKVYATSYSDPMGGLSQYYLASAFDEIWMQPVGMVSTSGASMEMPFAKEALDNLGVSANFFQREEFKSAMENFTNSKISPSNKQAMQSLLNSLSSKMVVDIAAERNIKGAVLKAQIDKGILTGQEALDTKLLDRLDYGDVMLSEIRQAVTGNPNDDSVELVTLASYSQHKAKSVKKGNNVALIYVTGTIVDSAGATGNAGADDIAGTITQAYKDDSIKAIVLRVDSPGGSPTASETIRRSLVKAKEKGKKVIVSMGPVAASGGYWISTDADMIVANAGTITGSIGVVMGKFEASELFSKLGINWQGPNFGENADIWSLHKKFDAQATQRMNVLIDDTYNSFITRVVSGRKLTPEQAKSVAKGRAWTGEQALERGLVDELGGLNDALDKTAMMLGKNNRHDLSVVKMPKELNNVERILELLGQQVSLGNFFGKVLSNFFGNVLGLDLGFIDAHMTQKKLLETGNHTTVYNPDLERLR